MLAAPFVCEEVEIRLLKHNRKPWFLRKLVAIAGIPGLSKAQKYKISVKHRDGGHNQGFSGECWRTAMLHMNDDVRVPIHGGKPKGWARSEITVPVIVSPADRYPWGVIQILSKRRLGEDERVEAASAINQEGDFRRTLERLLRWQRKGHVFNLAD